MIEFIVNQYSIKSRDYFDNRYAASITLNIIHPEIINSLNVSVGF